MPNEHRADPTPPPHHGQGRGGSKKESSSLRVSPALHPPERPSPRRADIADHGLGRETRERVQYKIIKHGLGRLSASGTERHRYAIALPDKLGTDSMAVDAIRTPSREVG